MKRIGFWFDVISPFAYLAFEHLPQALEGCSYEVQYRPVLFAGLLGHWGQKGPAEIAPKRAWTFRHIAWLSHTLNVPIQTPAMHPFNPLPLLRIALACSDAGGTPNRHVVESLMRHVWRGGADATDPARLRGLAEALAPRRDPGSDEVKGELRSWSNEAVARGVFGVPTFDLEGRLFWGVDALPMLRAALLGDPWFDGPQWDAAAVAPPGITR
ncbi:MAG TPA: 2-hydroxychromene-2-carboxylate isomerase [Burkholderiaceae bacterium]|nr:2-hydroxychromene-2-carboxylate isomerase [Burkholderiaceae bacterium]